MKISVGLLLTFLAATDAFVATARPRRALVPLFDTPEEAKDDSADEVEVPANAIEVQEEVIDEYRKNLSFKRTGVKESNVSEHQLVARPLILRCQLLSSVRIGFPNASSSFLTFVSHDSFFRRLMSR